MERVVVFKSFGDTAIIDKTDVVGVALADEVTGVTLIIGTAKSIKLGLDNGIDTP